jgi:hypothetical protein
MSNPKTNNNVQDTYFFSREKALITALENNYFVIPGSVVKGRQVCYHPGEKQQTDPENLISVPFDKADKFFSESILRKPTNIDYSDHPYGEIELQSKINAIRESISVWGPRLYIKFKKAASEIADFKFDKLPARLRICIWQTRYTTVLQYAALGLAKAFEKIGHEVNFIIEENDMQSVSSNKYLHIFKELANFKPHLFIDINALLSNRVISPCSYYVAWFQDPTDALINNTLPSWRDRDLVYKVGDSVDFNSTLKDHKNLQPLCVDDSIFHIDSRVKRKNKIVFVGSSYESQVADFANTHPQIFEKIKNDFTSGLPTNLPVYLSSLFTAEQMRSSSFATFVKYRLLNYVVRDICVEWICQQDIIDVEIYGRGWAENPIVAPFFKGELKHGSEVAKIYQSAKYALVCLPHEVVTQRLNEALACGCQPVVYDCRYACGPPYYEEALLYFGTQKELIGNLGKDLIIKTEALTAISAKYTYSSFAKRILLDLKKKERADEQGDSKRS